MNVIQLHLILNHLPVVGIFFATALWILGVWRCSLELKKIALVFYIFLAFATLPVYFTGEPAEERIEHLPGFSSELVERHEEAAAWAFGSIELLGLVAAAGLFYYRKATAHDGWFVRSILALAFLTSVLMAWTAHRGGRIRHFELNVTAGIPAE